MSEYERLIEEYDRWQAAEAAKATKMTTAQKIAAKVAIMNALDSLLKFVIEPAGEMPNKEDDPVFNAVMAAMGSLDEALGQLKT